MAKTTPSRAKSKTKAPKKPTQLDRIERSIGLIESKLATLNAWETLNEAMSNDKLASPTVAAEEIKPKELKAGDWVVVVSSPWGNNPECPYRIGDIAKIERWDSVHPWLYGKDNFPDGVCVGAKFLRPATPEEIAAHEAKAEAQAAEDAKLVFGARVEHISCGKGIWMGMDGILHELAFLNHGEGRLHQWSIVTCPRLTFTLLP